MLTFFGPKQRLCDGVPRRDFLKLGTLGLTGLALPEILRAHASATPANAPTRPRSVILICLPGGPSHIDTYDMKPDAQAEIRGEFRPIRTNVSGIDICEHLPRQARIADKLAIVRNMVFREPGHQLHEVYTGFPTADARPAFGSAVSHFLGQRDHVLPSYISLGIEDHPRTVQLAEVPAYAGPIHRPFVPTAEFRQGLLEGNTPDLDRLSDRRSLIGFFDGLRRELDANGEMQAMDEFHRRALQMVFSPAVRDAFDISREPQAIRDLYGPDVRLQYNYQFGHTWLSTKFLLARRLVEAGVPVVTIGMGGWDHHGDLNGVRGTIFERSAEQLPLYDRSIHALVTDLHQRGLADDVAVVVWGEFGRTPRVNRYGGRDHWTPAGFALFAGGGLRTGQTIGATDGRGERPRGPAYTPQNVLATLYHTLGIDPHHEIRDYTGRPRHLLDDTQPIRELIA